jgi:hypothetical protein
MDEARKQCLLVVYYSECLSFFLDPQQDSVRRITNHVQQDAQKRKEIKIYVRKFHVTSSQDYRSHQPLSTVCFSQLSV